MITQLGDRQYQIHFGNEDTVLRCFLLEKSKTMTYRDRD